MDPVFLMRGHRATSYYPWRSILCPTDDLITKLNLRRVLKIFILLQMRTLSMLSLTQLTRHTMPRHTRSFRLITLSWRSSQRLIFF